MRNQHPQNKIGLCSAVPITSEQWKWLLDRLEETVTDDAAAGGAILTGLEQATLTGATVNEEVELLPGDAFTEEFDSDPLGWGFNYS